MDPDLETATTEINVDLDLQEILLAASNHDVPKLRHLTRTYRGVANPANVRDPETGLTPLHVAIQACEPEHEEKVNGEPKPNGVSEADETETENETVKSGVETVRFLLREGAIWNDLDSNDETPGCIARRLGLTELYEVMVDAGVRAEMLLNRLDGYEPLSDAEEGEQQEEEGGEEGQQTEETQTQTQTQETATDPDVTNPRYLDSDLTFQHDRLLDQDQNGVMMAWESDIMDKSARKILPSPGLKVLNIGHGMGIVDRFIQSHSPSEHHIIEAHPSVITEMKRTGWADKPGVFIHEGKWQDIVPNLVGEGQQFDAIYYDTFAESYSDFRDFFTEHVIGLLDQNGRWGYFNGMGADRQISYDVYQKVVEMDLFEAGFDVEWEEIPVPKLEGEWSGVRRPYWVVDCYRLPVCRYMD